MDHTIPAGRPDLVVINKKKRTNFVFPADKNESPNSRWKIRQCCKKLIYFSLDFTVPVDQTMNLEKAEKVKKLKEYLYFARELKSYGILYCPRNPKKEIRKQEI